LGYVAFVADIYGGGQVTTDAKQAGAWATPFASDRSLTRARAGAALDQLKSNPNVDPTKIAAIGYCFGGMVVLELARSNADVVAVVSFHGNLGNPKPDANTTIKAKVLICHGADDSFVPPEQVAAFEEEMRKAKADWQFIAYGGAHHAFTNPDSDKYGLANVSYNEAADKRSWAAMKDFFAEVLGR
jgi:dienelactone hydrolase